MVILVVVVVVVVVVLVVDVVLIVVVVLVVVVAVHVPTQHELPQSEDSLEVPEQYGVAPPQHVPPYSAHVLKGDL